MTNHHVGGIVDRLLSEADKLYQKGRVQQAADTLLQAIRQFSTDKRPYCAFAEMLIDGNQFEEGLALLEKFPHANHDPQILELTGYCLMGIDRLDEAEECARKLLAKNPVSAPGLNLLGRLAYHRGDGAGAEDYFRQAIHAEPEHSEARVNLGIMHWERGQQEVALDLIEQGLNYRPADMKAASTYHTAVTELAEFERSEAVLRTAVKDCPFNARLRYFLIDVLVNQQKHVSALNEIQKSLAVFGASEDMLAAAEKVKALAAQNSDSKPDTRECRLSACMIVKNEADHLAKCLQSLKQLVDEIIVVDTGSKDLTKEIAAIFGARVIEFKWVDDFAKAKNFAISKATGEWILSMDADEVISPLDHGAMRNLIKKSGPDLVAYSVVTRNYMNRVNALGWSPNDGKYEEEEAGYGWFPSEKVRLFPNHAGIRFEYPVHEMVEPSLERLGIDIFPCHIPIHHYGKLNEQNSAAKGMAYFQIGIKKLDEMEHSVEAIRELAIQATNLEKYEEAVSLWLKVIGLQPEMADAFVNLGTAYWNLGNYREAVESAKKAMELAPNMKEARFNYCLSLLHLGQADSTIVVLKTLLDEFPEYLSARFLLAAVQCCSGHMQIGTRELKNLKGSQLGAGLAISCHTLAQGLQAAGQIDYARTILEAACETENANDDVRALLAMCKDTP
jgi:tetratricopeptide (TPR) repeat protein